MREKFQRGGNAGFHNFNGSHFHFNGGGDEDFDPFVRYNLQRIYSTCFSQVEEEEQEEKDLQG